MSSHTAIPEHMNRLRIDPVRKIPVPWFVAWLNGNPEFRIADGDKLGKAIRERLCWVCGNHIPRRFEMAYVIGPMCGVNRTTAEPPCHLDCARYSAIHCPFLSRPAMDRRESGLPPEAAKADCAGHMIRRNPGCCLLWITKQPPELFSDHRGGVLFRLCDPSRIECYAEGRLARVEQIMESIASGYPILHEMAAQEGKLAVAELELARDQFLVMFKKYAKVEAACV